MALETMKQSADILLSVAREISEAWEDKKIQFGEYFEIGIPLLRVPRIIAKREKFFADLKAWRESQELRIELVEYIAENLDLEQEIAEAIIRRVIQFYIETEKFIYEVSELLKGNIPDGVNLKEEAKAFSYTYRL